MTYFYAQLFTMDTEIRAMFPAAMDVQRRRLFAALSQIAAAQGSDDDRDQLVPYHGARRHQDLYDLRALRDMEEAYPWLQVIPAVSDEPVHDHDIVYGTIPELAAKASWTDRDIYISGPGHMIVRTVRALGERGAPGRLIHYDLDPKAAEGNPLRPPAVGGR
jgi:NAD(P)H-flavin reductase